MEKVLQDLAVAQGEYDSSTTGHASNRPFVLLSWAQSMDGFIASAPGIQTQISNSSTGELTHRLRAFCDAILVGIGTVLVDDPRLSVRLQTEESSDLKSPRPVVLDTNLRIPISSKLLRSDVGSNACVRRGRPIVFTAESSLQHIPESDMDRKTSPEFMKLADSADIVGTRVGPDGRMRLDCILRKLAETGVRTVMIEGGSAILRAFVDSDLCDFAVVTMSAQLFGGGVPVLAPTVSGRAVPALRLSRPQWLALDGDMVCWGSISSSTSGASP